MLMLNRRIESGRRRVKPVPTIRITETGIWSGEVDLTVSALSSDVNSSLATEYGDYNVVSGAFALNYDRPDQYYFHLNGEQIAEDDQNYSLQGGRYGFVDVEAGYSELPHRYAFDAKTLYSGVGSTSLTIDNTLQSDLQALSTDPQAQTLLLSNTLTNAETGDPAIMRKHQNLAVKLTAFEPLSFRVELGMETQKGTRPRFGAFGLAHTVELFEPIDSNTLNVRFITEYAGKNILLNAEYYMQRYDNQLDYLDFDNPLRIDDAIGNPSKGRLALAPDNFYQGVTLSGAYGNLPFHSRLSATVGLGWMSQDAKLTALTTNSALNAPIDYSDPASLPRDRAGAKVDTSLFRLMLTSRPASFFNLKAAYTFYDYDNNSDIIIFSGWLCEFGFPARHQLCRHADRHIADQLSSIQIGDGSGISAFRVRPG